MKRMLRGSLLCLALGVTGLGSAEPCSGQIVLNEILGDPAQDWDGDGAVDFKNDEWIEIANIGTTTLSLDSLRVSDASDVFRMGLQGILAPGQHLLILGSDSVAWETATGHSTVGLSLNNGGDTVRLWQLAGNDTLLVDEYTYAAHEAEDDRSTARMPNSSEWQIFDALNPWTGADPPASTGCPPTPGTENLCPTSVDESTWSSVKLLFQDGAEPRPGTGDRP